MKVLDIDIEKVSQLSSKDRDYLMQSEGFRSFFKYDFEFNAFKSVIEERSKFNTHRSLLSQTLAKQYEQIIASQTTLSNIDALASDKTFTVITAHQPSLMTGPLYVPFKILSAIHIADQLKKSYPDLNFVPIYISGGEDHDIEEVNHAHLFGKRIEWAANEGGSVGEYSTKDLSEVADNMIDLLGSNTKIAELLSEIKSMTLESESYGDFNFKLINRLFGKFGLVMANMNNPAFKKAFIPIIKREIFESYSQPLILQTQEKLEALDYKAQTHIREINFFYKAKNLRNRIEKKDDYYVVVDTDLKFTKSEMEAEIDNHPERFSPNVIMRPLYQELIFPNLAYVGGGGEIAYWLERKTQFEDSGIPFPMLVRRQSASIIHANVQKQLDKVSLDYLALFNNYEGLVKNYLDISDSPDYKLSAFKKRISELFDEIADKTKSIDASLVKTSKAEMAKSIKSIDYLESKLKKSVKQKEEVALNRIKKLKDKYFPGDGLQERYENIFEYLSMYGETILEDILPHCNPFDKKFKLFIMQPDGQQKA